MSLKIEFETITAPVAPPHEYLPIIDQLIDAGPDQAATVVCDNEADAKAYVLEMQKAARQRGMSGVKAWVASLALLGMHLALALLRWDGRSFDRARGNVAGMLDEMLGRARSVGGFLK